MKNFTLLVMSLLLSLGVSQRGFSMTGGGADCGCDGNVLKNASFESTSDWTKSSGTNFYLSSTYNMCGSKNGMIKDKGSIYQFVDVAAGSTINFSAYGATHKTSFTHEFRLIFFNNSNQELGRKTIDMNYTVKSDNKLAPFSTTATAPANTTKMAVVIYSGGDYFKFDAACLKITNPYPADCGCPGIENALKNSGFESGSLGNWTKTSGTSAYLNTDYSQCGRYAAIIDGIGTLYQEVATSAGAKVEVTIYGGTHNTDYRHDFELAFYNSAGQKLGNSKTESMNYKVTQKHKLQQFSLSATAPAGTAKVRISAISKGNYFKIDVACMKITTPPPSDCGCPDSENAFKNGSFENGSDNWTVTSGTDFKTEPPYAVCGSKNGLITGSGSIYQEVNLTAGSTVDVKIFGGTHNASQDHKFKLEFYNASNQLIAIPVTPENTVQVDFVPSAQNQLQEYNLSATAPFGATKVRLTASSNGNYLKIDGVCGSINPPTPPTCETCVDNKLTNASFEDGTNGWATTGTVVSMDVLPGCGTNELVLSGSASATQEIAFSPNFGNAVTLVFWGAVMENRDQKVQIVFVDASNKVLEGGLTKDIDKLVNDDPYGLERYTLAGLIPEGTVKIRIVFSQTSDYLAVDGACLTFSGPPLPVTLAKFDAKKEGATVNLEWTTTFETNSDHFDVQHSTDGKNWNVLTTIKAQGESNTIVPYRYTHTSPLAVNLYRLKMVDADQTFAYSAIKSVNFSGEEGMSIYPNPATDRIKFDTKMTISNVKVYNQNGSLVIDTAPNAANEVDLTRLAQGIYFVKVNNGTSTRKIVVAK